MTAYSDVAIVFNPNSTGDAQDNAKNFQAEIRASLPKLPVELVPTQHAGHGEELAYTFAKDHARPLIVSASGDGGYNDVINGALRAQAEGARPICAVLPSGNANDHARTIQLQPLSELVINERITQLDVLRLSAVSPDGKTKERYAHSYIGIGLTPSVAAELNKHKLNTLRELGIIIRTFIHLNPVPIMMDGKKLQVDSLICGTISEMAKVLTLSYDSDPRDGKFEVAVFAHSHKALLLLRLIKGAVLRLGADRQTDTLKFTLLSAAPLQLDGELIDLTKDTAVTVTIERQALQTVAGI